MSVRIPFRVVDNFLDVFVFKNLLSIFDSSILWEYHDDATNSGHFEKNDIYLSHNFFQANVGIFNTKYYDQVNPLIEKLQQDELLNIRANLNFFLDNPYVTESHIDHDMIGWKTCILYMNDNNGKTRIDDLGIDIHCKSNRLLVFDSNLYHSAVIQTDTKERIVINVNFKPKPGSIFDF